jgi:hypothetical protein
MPKVSADLLIEGQKGVEYCFQISNMDEFPDYAFVVHYPRVMEGYNVIENGECVSFYKYNVPVIYAINKSLFDEKPLAGIMNSENRSKLSEYFASDGNFIPSDVSIKPVSTLPDTDPTDKVVDEMKIISVGGNKLDIEKSKVIYTFSDGTSEEKTYVDQNVRPASSRQPIIPVNSFQILYFVLPAAALIIIAAILIMRKTRKKKGADDVHPI